MKPEDFELTVSYSKEPCQGEHWVARAKELPDVEVWHNCPASALDELVTRIERAGKVLHGTERDGNDRLVSLRKRLDVLSPVDGALKMRLAHSG